MVFRRFEAAAQRLGRARSAGCAVLLALLAPLSLPCAARDLVAARELQFVAAPAPFVSTLMLHQVDARPIMSAHSEDRVYHPWVSPQQFDHVLTELGARGYHVVSLDVALAVLLNNAHTSYGRRERGAVVHDIAVWRSRYAVSGIFLKTRWPTPMAMSITTSTSPAAHEAWGSGGSLGIRGLRRAPRLWAPSTRSSFAKRPACRRRRRAPRSGADSPADSVRRTNIRTRRTGRRSDVLLYTVCIPFYFDDLLSALDTGPR